MRSSSRVVVLAMACVALGSALVQATRSNEPLWAYGFLTPPALGDTAPPPQNPPTRRLRPNEDPAEQTRLRRLEGSPAAYSLVDIRDGHNVIDWFPGDHPSPMPDIISHGPKKLGDISRGCGSCHLPNGKGRPENAQPGGLPAEYILRQLREFRLGLRRSADWRKPNTYTMMKLAMAMTDEEMNAAAEYFSAVRWNTRWVRVVETDYVPKTHIAGNLFIATGSARTEPIAGRIIEVPADEELSEVYRSPRSGFVAYVPVGSIAEGEKLVTTGGAIVVDNRIVPGKTVACGACHGKDLMGLDDAPPIAGRSPSYLARQLYDFQEGTRNGASAPLMRAVVAHLTPEDIVNIAAYVASRFAPPGVRPPASLPAGRPPAIDTATR